jgi:hypothetical protein
LTKDTVVKPSIRPDIRYPALTGYPAGYPAFGLAGHPAGRISGKNSIRCIPIILSQFFFVWLQTAIKLEQVDWTSERDPEMDVDQFFHTASPVTIYQMVDENLQVGNFPLNT